MFKFPIYCLKQGLFLFGFIFILRDRALQQNLFIRYSKNKKHSPIYLKATKLLTERSMKFVVRLQNLE